MFNLKTIKIRLFIRMIALILCLHGLVFGEDCADDKGATQTPTPAGNAEYANLWRDQCAPIIYDDDDDDMVDSGGSVKLWVDSGGLACPPYTWSTSNTGWSLYSNETENDLETVTLSLIDTSGKTCGTDYDVYAILTVTDDYGVTDDIVIRYSGGQWVFDKYTSSCELAGAGTFISYTDHTCISELSQGIYKYRQRTVREGTHNTAGPCSTTNHCLGYSSGWKREPCITLADDFYIVPCKDCPRESLPNRVCCWHISKIEKWVWSCP
jgi:hypothetical protein